MTDSVCAICKRPYEPEGGSLIAHVLEYGHSFAPSAPKAPEEHADGAAEDWSDAECNFGD